MGLKNLREALRGTELIRERYVFIKIGEGWLFIFNGLPQFLKGDIGFNCLHYCMEKFPQRIDNSELDLRFGRGWGYKDPVKDGSNADKPEETPRQKDRKHTQTSGYREIIDKEAVREYGERVQRLMAIIGKEEEEFPGEKTSAEMES